MSFSQFIAREINYDVSPLIRMFQHRDAQEMDEKYIELVHHFDTEGEPVDILEYWCVSKWLADKLKEFSEPVVTNFFGLAVWGRTTSGQSIKMDDVIREIYQEHCL